jgi:hypothetical protein
MTMTRAETEIIHYPSLRTVLMVEKVLKEADGTLTRAELKRRLPMQIMHQTLNVVLSYLSERGMIFDDRKGIIWTFNPSKKLERAIARGTEV